MKQEIADLLKAISRLIDEAEARGIKRVEEELRNVREHVVSLALEL